MLSALFIAAACTDTPAEPESKDDSNITLSISSLSFLNTGEAIDGEASVTVECNGAWRLVGKDDWCHPSVTEGQSGATVTFKADPNPATESRTAIFSFVSGSKTVKLHVMQKFSDVIELYKDEFKLPREGGQITVRASSNTEVIVNIPEDCRSWIEQMATPASKSLDLNVFYFDIHATNEYFTRNGRIEFISGDNTAYADISQEKNVIMETSEKAYKAEGNGDIIEVEVSTNLPYKVEIPETASDWIEYIDNDESEEIPNGPVQRKETFKIKADKEDMSRAVQISLVSLDENNSLEESFVIIQSGTNPQIIEIPDINFRNALAELAYVVTFDSNGDEYENGKCEISVAGNQATDLDVHSKNISSLVGIEHFKNLTLLNCRNNNIRELDLSNTKIDVKYVSYGNKTIIDGNPYEILILNSNSNTLSLQANDPYNKDILGLTGADGTSPTTLKIIGPGLQFAYLAGNTSLKSINLYNCPNIPGTMYCSFTGLSNCTVYLNQKTQINSPVEGVEFKYENPEQ